MGKGKGIAAIIFFAIFTFFTSAIAFSGEFVFMANLWFFLISLSAWTTGLLVPGILCLLEKKVKNVYKYLYTILPVTLFWFLLYTFVIAIAFRENFMVGYIGFLALGLGLSVLGGLIVAGLSAIYPY